MYNKVNEILCGDCLDLMKEIPDNTFDSFITDPPYALTTTKRWKDSTEFAQNQSDVGKRFSKGFMGKEWDGKLPDVDTWKECLRVAKPGAHLLAFGGTRTHHRLMVAIEDAGWEIRDCLMWVYGSGFPKSLDVSKAIDKAAGVEREVVGKDPEAGRRNKATPRFNGTDYAGGNEWQGATEVPLTAPTTEAAKQWNGWGTALKPAYEIIILARKPLDGTVAQNVLKWGCGGINVDGCRVEGKLGGNPNRFTKAYSMGNGNEGWKRPAHENYIPPIVRDEGRFPANLIHDGSDEVLALFPESKCGAFNGHRNLPKSNNTYNHFALQNEIGHEASSGSAARFFYCAKASKSERGFGNIHPTVKPLSLMQYLCRLITPPRGLICDPFCGSGSTCIAAIKEGFNYVGIDKDQSSVDIANKRIFDNI